MEFQKHSKVQAGFSPSKNASLDNHQLSSASYRNQQEALNQIDGNFLSIAIYLVTTNIKITNGNHFFDRVSIRPFPKE